MTQNQEDFNAVFGAILCGRCVCGERLWFNGGEVYKGLPDCTLDTLIDDANTWLTENKTQISEALAEYYKYTENPDYYQIDAWKFKNEYNPDEYISIDKLYTLVAEFREVVPILVRIRDEAESCHLICMLDRLKCD